MDDYLNKYDLKWESVRSVCTGRAPALNWSTIRVWKKGERLTVVPDATSIHCIIHRQALASRTVPSDVQLALNIVERAR